MPHYEIGDLVEFIQPFDHEGDGQVDKNWKKRYIAIVVDNKPRPAKNVVKVYYKMKPRWVPTQWIKKIDDDKEAK
jgi:hypothetical protein